MNLDELEAAARAALPITTRWRVEGPVAIEEFLAACAPERILALIRVARAARKASDLDRKVVYGNCGDCQTPEICDRNRTCHKTPIGSFGFILNKPLNDLDAL